MARWAGVREVVLRQEGHPAPNGLGAIRVIRSTGVVVEEEITAFDPPKRLAYQMVPGLLFRDYQAEVQLDACPKGTAVRWRVRLSPRFPGTGWLLHRAVQRALTTMLTRLAEHRFGV